MKSKITSKFQVTIPREVRKRLKLDVADSIEWTFEDGRVFVRPVKSPFMRHRASVKVGPGEIREDIEQAREHRGKRHG